MSKLQADRLTHVIFAFAHLAADGSLSVEVGEPTARLERLLRVARERPTLRVQFAIGGWENSQHFSRLVATAESRHTLVDSIVGFIERYKLDGVDIGESSRGFKMRLQARFALF